VRCNHEILPTTDLGWQGYKLDVFGSGFSLMERGLTERLRCFRKLGFVSLGLTDFLVNLPVRRCNTSFVRLLGLNLLTFVRQCLQNFSNLL
jgi:hypothetical protein